MSDEPRNLPGTQVQFHHDTRLSRDNEITAYVHCSLCLREKPPGVSPKDWSRTQTGITAEGHIQVWCNRHEANVTIIRAVTARAGRRT